MKVYLAGGITGNLKPYFSRVSKKVYSGEVKTLLSDDDDMKLFLAGFNGGRELLNKENQNVSPEIREYKPYILESFYYMDDDIERLLPTFGDFMLDSGAFTFCGTGGIDIKKLDEYLEKYADFINRKKIDKFFELDIDSIVGYEKVLEYRKRLEKLTGKQTIPVWHISRGKDEFIKSTEEYKYVALGGYVAAIKASDPRQRAYIKSYPWFIREAHKRGTKIHGLGFTSLTGLEKYHFDSVDSTAWTTGNRFGYLYFFDGKTMKKRDAPVGYRLSDPRAVALNNFTEWIKYQKYADRHL